MDLYKLSKLPLFTNKDLKLHYNIKYPEIYIQKLKNKNKIITIEKGKYTLQEDILCYVTQIVNPSYLSFLSALNFYGYSTQILQKYSVAIKNNKKDLKYIKFIKINSKYFFGYNKVNYGGFDLFIVDKEKLLLDCLLYQNYVQVSDIFELLKDNLDKNKLLNYLLKINNISLIKRTGYLLDLVGINIFDVFKNKLNNNNFYVKLNINLKRSKINNSKWKLNINEVIDI
jgi:predicted transcriptional regulator of viral defense system